ncbi:MAG: right-handed parallel beta-helix repeat-containing protein, partial [Acidimicrobiales bacterium]|nr:right-handed parallel beta-helix repeat-containing protein [Acidimicrobiales bacterium]
MTATARRHSGLLLALATVASAVAILAPAPAGADPTLIGCDQAAVRVEVTADAVLDGGCTYTAGFDITASNVTLDCAGARIASAPGDSGRGILVHAPVDVDLTDVTVRNCRVEGFLNGIKVTRDGFRDLADGEEFEHSTARILLVDNEVANTRGVGIFVDGYVSDVRIERNLVTGTGSSGIYLDTGSRANAVLDNEIVDNGYIENGPDGSPYDAGGTIVWRWGTGREGLSIDGSSDNHVAGNRFSGNAAGGILLYKNCGEYPDSGRYYERRDPSDRNLIEDNEFVGGRNGIWVGSRMGENTLP